ncbi:LysR substrate-binding domain-containing protein [Paracoccus sp. (in: a-proteobacteria)]|uniref:LysR substrate-binding domain-containing protein n=1 Tax=Paracoccus sp. TaxID=267 RepID=UPI0026DFF275|nr:LysR substrate-binding domain-containing protein [Paracoccus sp. (in: a-proteobacteria)]MDO5648788.1 LysR substrate-binding domain-containing protein [Paracoccus sp. (in: a-proteobacteria)]
MPRNWGRLREYEVIRAVMATGSTAAAARQLGVSQPSVSRSIAQLEERRGVMLFARRGGRLHPTAEAVLLNTRLDSLFDALSTIEGLDDGRSGPATLRLIAPPSITHAFLPAQIARFISANPGQPVSLQTASSRDMIGRLAANDADLGITTAELTHSKLERVPFYQALAVCVMRHDHPLAARDRITPDDLDGTAIVMMARGQMIRARLERIFAGADISPRRVAEVTTGAAAAALVREGLGLSILCPFPIIHPSERVLITRPFAPEILYQTSFLIPATRPLNAPGRAFMRQFRTAVAAWGKAAL